MTRKQYAIMFILFGVGIVSVGLVGFFIYDSMTTPYRDNFIRTPNVFKEHPELSCGNGTGYQVSGTDQYGYGWAGCFYHGCEYDESVARDYMKCVAVTLVE